MIRMSLPTVGEMSGTVCQEFNCYQYKFMYFSTIFPGPNIPVTLLVAQVFSRP
jgi:hypothetical protein